MDKVSGRGGGDHETRERHEIGKFVRCGCGGSRGRFTKSSRSFQSGEAAKRRRRRKGGAGGAQSVGVNHETRERHEIGKFVRCGCGGSRGRFTKSSRSFQSGVAAKRRRRRKGGAGGAKSVGVTTEHAKGTKFGGSCGVAAAVAAEDSRRAVDFSERSSREEAQAARRVSGCTTKHTKGTKLGSSCDVAAAVAAEDPRRAVELFRAE